MSATPMDSILLRATQTGRVKWLFLKEALSAFDNPQFGHIGLVGEPVVCRWKERWFRLYEYRYKYWTDEDRFEWTANVSLELVDEPGGTILAELRMGDDRWALLEAARIKAAGIDRLMEELVVDLDSTEDENEIDLQGTKRK